MMTIILCFAEVASRFQRAGGAYLYARVALGRLAGIDMAWLSYLVRLTAAATNANLFVIYLAEFWPRATDPVESRVLLALMIAPLAVANYRGIGTGLGVSSAFTAAKLVPLGVFVVAGIGVLLTGGAALPGSPATPAPLGTWLEAILLLVFAYGGFEAALFPLGEAKDPRRDAPIALLVALGAAPSCTPGAGGRGRDAADPAAGPWPTRPEPFWAPRGVAPGAWGAGLRVRLHGRCHARGSAPHLRDGGAGRPPVPHGGVHPRFRTPHVSVVVFATLSWLMAASSGFLQNLSLSAVSRLLTYGVVCVAVLVLRRRDADPPWFRIPGGRRRRAARSGVHRGAGTADESARAGSLTLTMALGLAHWWWMRG